jgi:hypothetical protein
LFEGHKEKLDRGFDILPDSMEIYWDIPVTPKDFLGNRIK